MEHKLEVTFHLGERIHAGELLDLLEKIDESGSLNQGAAAAGLSYRHGWGLLNRSEDALGKTLVVRKTGGASGGGTYLTADGVAILGHLRQLQRDAQTQLAAILGQRDEGKSRQIMLASSMEPIVSGLLDVLEQLYYQKTQVAVRHVAAGSGQAMELARAGRADILLTHAPALERQFLDEGWGTRIIPVMRNDFILAGPPDDPAGAQRAGSVPAALQAIAKARAPFISRGDRSGTHLKEMSLWQEAKIEPLGTQWYIPVVNTLGNHGILRRAAAEGAYALADRASFLTGRMSGKLRIYSAGDDLLRNIFSLLPVSRKMAAVNQTEAEKFADWFAGGEARKVIAAFGAKQYRRPLFEPLPEADSAGGTDNRAGG